MTSEFKFKVGDKVVFKAVEQPDRGKRFYRVIDRKLEPESLTGRVYCVNTYKYMYWWDESWFELFVETDEHD